jgi:hypothetical protein
MATKVLGAWMVLLYLGAMVSLYTDMPLVLGVTACYAAYGIYRALKETP